MSRPVEYATDAAAAAAVTSPFWLEALRQASMVAGILVPILGACWLAVQIAHKLRHWDDR
jgi:hypothetical protein